MLPLNAESVFVILVTSAISNNVAYSPPSAPLSVCELLEKRLIYDGKLVIVRGVVQGSAEGAILIANHCNKAIITEGFKWPNAIALSYNPGIDSTHTIDFVRDQKQIDTIHRQARRIKREHRHAIITYTYVGLFETRTNLGLAVNRAGEHIPAGFGHLNACPAQLIIKTIKDLHVKSLK